MSEEERRVRVKRWKQIAEAAYSDPESSHLPETRLALEAAITNPREGGVGAVHERDFLNEEIPAIIERVQQEGTGRKPVILDSGCGLGFFTDQIRAKFGDRVKVYGTSIEKSTSRKRKLHIIEKLREGHTWYKKQGMDPVKKEELLAYYDGVEKHGDTMHPNDAKWRSLREMRDFPEFDLIIDTYGEFYYASIESSVDASRKHLFDDLFEAAIKKLRPGGQLYMSPLDDATTNKLRMRIKQMENEMGVTIDYNVETENWVITKNADETASTMSEQ